MTGPRPIGATMLVVLVAGCGILQPTPEPATVPTPAVPVPSSTCLEGAPPPAAPVYAFFTCTDAPLPSDPRPVPREAHAADLQSRLEAALIGLLAGPTEAERHAGYSSLFSEETDGALSGAAIDADGMASVDLGDVRFLNNASTSAGAGVLLGELNATVFQFEEITAVVYRINGSCDAFWEWLQSACQVIARP